MLHNGRSDNKKCIAIKTSVNYFNYRYFCFCLVLFCFCIKSVPKVFQETAGEVILPNLG